MELDKGVLMGCLPLTGLAKIKVRTDGAFKPNTPNRASSTFISDHTNMDQWGGIWVGDPDLEHGMPGEMHILLFTDRTEVIIQTNTTLKS